MNRAVLAAAMLAAGAAAAAPPRQLTRAEIMAAEQAAQARLPRPDPQAVQACKAKETSAPDEIELATCLARAGALGTAIALLKNAIYLHRGEPAVKQARLDLAALEERAGNYQAEADDLAAWDGDYGASPVATAADRAEGERARTHAICLWLQLGDRRGEGESRHRKDRDHMCDGLALIAVPAAGTP